MESRPPEHLDSPYSSASGSESLDSGGIALPIVQSIAVNEALLISGLREHELRENAENLAEECKKLMDLARVASLTAERANSAKDVFLAALSHELRTPLNPALLLASEGASNSNWSDEVRGDFAAIEKNILLEAHLIDELLDFAKIAQGKIVLNMELVAVNEVLKDAFGNVQADIDARNLSLSVKRFSDNPVIMGDPLRLQQVFWNVLKNAAKFTASGGRISLETSIDSARRMLVMRFIDTGIGIDPTDLPHIFEPFKQADHSGHSVTHRTGGLGLGLAITKSILELHSGTIRAESDGLGWGSIFTIELPFVSQKISAPPPIAKGRLRSVLAPGQTPIRLLIVEDDTASRKALERMLAARNFDVSSAGTFDEATRLGSLNPFDLLLTDIDLPDGNGLELLEVCTRKSPRIKGIVISGFGMESDIILSKTAKFSAHLVKPVGIDVLERALNSVMEEKTLLERRS